MTEYFSPEGQFVDRTTTRTGSKNINGLNCNWQLHALPEYVNDDEKLSMGVINKVTDVLIKKGYKNATVIVVEGYENEELEKEHYRLSMIFGDGNENKKFVYSRGYSAKGDHGEVKGEVKSTVGLPIDSDEDHLEVSEETASIYIGEMESTYTDWKNEWEGGGFIEKSNKKSP